MMATRGRLRREEPGATVFTRAKSQRAGIELASRPGGEKARGAGRGRAGRRCAPPTPSLPPFPPGTHAPHSLGPTQAAPMALAAKLYMSVTSAMTTSVGLPAPCPARICTRVSRGLR